MMDAKNGLYSVVFVGHRAAKGEKQKESGR